MTTARSLAFAPLPRRVNVVAAGLVLGAVVFVARAAALLSPFTPHPVWTNTAATLDLTFTASLVAWWMLGRDFGWSLRALVALFVGSLMLAGAVLPSAAEGPLRMMHLATAPLELVLLVWLFRRISAARRKALAATAAAGRPDAQDTILAATSEVVSRGRFAEMLADEMTVLYYALSRRPGGATPADATLDERTLTYHRKSAYGAAVFALILATLAEVPAMHLLLRLWSERAAWVMTALGLYAVLWLVGDWRACRLRPMHVEDGTLRIRFGLRWRLDIPVERVVRMRAPTAAERATKRAMDLRLALPGVSWTVLELDHPVTAVGMYGRRRSVRSLGLGLDEPARLETLLSAAGAADDTTYAATTNPISEGHA